MRITTCGAVAFVGLLFTGTVACAQSLNQARVGLENPPAHLATAAHSVAAVHIVPADDYRMAGAIAGGIGGSILGVVLARNAEGSGVVVVGAVLFGALGAVLGAVLGGSMRR